MGAIDRIREYRQSHGTVYTLKRLGQKAAQQFLGTYDRRWKRERASEAELKAQRENQPAAGLISVVIPVYNTAPGMLNALLDSLENRNRVIVFWGEIFFSCLSLYATTNCFLQNIPS